MYKFIKFCNREQVDEACGFLALAGMVTRVRNFKTGFRLVADGEFKVVLDVLNAQGFINHAGEALNQNCFQDIQTGHVEIMLRYIK